MPALGEIFIDRLSEEVADATIFFEADLFDEPDRAAGKIDGRARIFCRTG